MRPRHRLASAVALGVLGISCERSSEDAWTRRIGELRELARPAEERLARGPASDDLRARLAELDRQLQELVPADKVPTPQGLIATTLAADLDAYRAQVERSRPALDRWLHTEQCATPPGDVSKGSEDWMPLRWRVDARLRRGERIAQGIPRLRDLRNWGNLLAWRAYFQSKAPPGDNVEPWDLGPADILASTFPLVSAFDDGSLIGTMVRVGVEHQTLLAARTLQRQRCITAHALRDALEPVLTASASYEPDQMIAADLRQFLEIYDKIYDPRAAEDGLRSSAGVEEAIRLARLPVQDFYREIGESSGQARQDPGNFEGSCVSALRQLHRHRSIMALFRVALAIEEYRERTGALPEDLDEIADSFTSGMPLDPLTDEAFVWVREERGGRLGPVAYAARERPGSTFNWSMGTEQLLAWEF